MITQALLFFSFLFNLYALPLEVEEDIAQEMFNEGHYSKAIDKCKSILKRSNSINCQKITNKSLSILSNKKIETQKQIESKNKALELENIKRKAEKALIAQKKKEKELKTKSSFEYNNDKVCSCNLADSYFTELINEEKSNPSGVFNSNKVYNWGKLIQIADKAKKYYLSQLQRNKFTYNSTKCPTINKSTEVYAMCINDTPLEYLQ